MVTVKAIRVHDYGGPEVLRYEDVELDAPGPGEALVRHRAIGLNFADIHTRAGRYPLPELPGGLGGEGMGLVEAIGAEHLHLPEAGHLSPVEAPHMVSEHLGLHFGRHLP